MAYGCCTCLLFPRMVSLLMEGLMPISEAQETSFKREISRGKEVYIGLDAAVTTGHPTVVSSIPDHDPYYTGAGNHSASQRLLPYATTLLCFHLQ